MHASGLLESRKLIPCFDDCTMNLKNVIIGGCGTIN